MIKFGTSNNYEGRDEENNDGKSLETDDEDAAMKIEEEHVEDFHPGDYVEVLDGAFYVILCSRDFSRLWQ